MSERFTDKVLEQAPPVLHTARWRFGAFELDESRRELRRDGSLLSIEPKPLALLMAMLRSPNEVLSKNELIDAVWPGGMVSDAALANCVGKLRTVLGTDGGAAIHTVFGFGYRFDAAVEHMAAGTVVLPPSLVLKNDDPVPGNAVWKLVRRLGRSGDSWLARHERSGQLQVFKFTQSPRALPALKREVTIYRLLKASIPGQPCFVGVHEWNFDEPPWFVQFEYCEGGSLLDWLTSLGGASALPLPARVELLARIADAVAAVHLVGVLHKDLKPANIFVVPDPAEPKSCPAIRLGDFGSGRVFDDERLIALGISRMGVTQTVAAGDSTSGTPLYYAPEVLAGQPPTIKSDLFALGVMLYQLAAGDLNYQFAPGWEQDIDDPLLRDDIAAAAAGRTELRLSDAAELARRLRQLPARRQLAREAAQQLAETAAAQSRERARAVAAEQAVERMRARRTGLRMALAAASMGIALSSFLYIDAVKSRDDARAASVRAEAVRDFLAEGIFATIDPNRRSVESLTVKELLDTASESMTGRFTDEPRVEADLRKSIGTSYVALEANAEAVRELERALELYESTLGQGSAEALTVAAALVVNKGALGDLDEFEPRLAELEAAGRQRLGADAIPLLRLRLERARIAHFRGQWRATADQLAGVMAALPAGGQGREEIALPAAMLYATSLSDLGAHDDAIAQLRALVDNHTRKSGGDSLIVGKLRARLGYALVEAGRIPVAAVELARAREIVQQHVLADSGILLLIRWYEAQITIARGDDGAAEAMLVPLIADIDRVSEGYASQAGPMRQTLAGIAIRAGRLDEAEVMLKRALYDLERIDGPSHPATQAARVQLAQLLVDRGDRDAALHLINAAPLISFDTLPERHPFVVALGNLKASLGS